MLEAVKERARRGGRSAGEVLSDLARRELTRVSTTGVRTTQNGFPLLPHRGTAVTNALIDRLRDEENV